MKYKITTYVLAVAAAILLAVSLLLGYNFIDLKSSTKKQNVESSLVISVLDIEKEGEDRLVFDELQNKVFGKTLLDVISNNSKFKISNGFVESIEGVEMPKDTFWSISSETNSKCKYLEGHSCMVGAQELYMNVENEFTFTLTSWA